jgi:hypothetical protein
MDDFSPEFSAKIREAYAQGHTPEDIIAHFENTNHPEGMKWANQMKELQGGSDVVPMSLPSANTAPSFRDTTSPLIDTYSRNAELLKNETKDMSLKDQAIAGAEIAAGLYAGKKVIDISSRMLHNLTPQGRLEIEKAKVDLEASKESSKNYAIQTQTAAKKLELEQQLAANAQPSSLDELKAQALMNEEKRKQELHDFKMEQLKQKVIKGQTQADKIAASTDVMQTPEILNSTGLTGLTELEKNKGVTFASNQGPELESVLKGENISAIKNGQNPPYPHLLNNPVTPPTPVATTDEVKAIEAGVTPSTSPQEAQTLVTTSEAAKDPIEKSKEPIAPKALKTGSGMPAFQGIAPTGTPFKKEFASIADVPSTHAFVPGGQLMDIIRNSVGQEAYTASLAKHGFPTTQKEAHAISRQINESMGRLNRDVAKDLNIGLGEPTKAISKKNPEGGKAFKVAGTLGALVLMSDLVNAETPEQKRKAIRNLGESFLPTSVTPTEAGAPVLPPGAYSESKKLGSPFHVFPNQGRGIMPPSAYR